MELPPLVAQLGALLRTPPASIEIIPGDGSEFFVTTQSDSPDHDALAGPGVTGTVDQAHRPFLFQEGNLGVPHKVLYKIYPQAVSSFSRLRETRREAQRSDSDKVSLDGVDEAMYLTTSVILLTIPAHATALNVRKTLLNRTSTSLSLINIIDPAAELVFLTALLTGVRDAAKSSLLWTYRLALLHGVHCRDWSTEHLHTSQDLEHKTCAIPLSALTDELSIVSRACELYPRNYHAWGYRTTLFLLLPRLVQVNSDPCREKEFVQAEIETMRQWIETHVSDHSAVNHLCVLLQDLGQYHVGDGRHLELIDNSDRSRALEHAVSLIQVYPTHESIWLYLRACIFILSPQNRSTKISEVPQTTSNLTTHAIEIAAQLADTTVSLPENEALLLRWNATRFQQWCQRSGVRAVNDSV